MRFCSRPSDSGTFTLVGQVTYNAQGPGRHDVKAAEHGVIDVLAGDVIGYHSPKGVANIIWFGSATCPKGQVGRKF